MGNVRHLISEVEGSGALFAAGYVNVTSTTAVGATRTVTVESISTPLAFTGDITVQPIATGRYTVNLTNFKGPLGYAIPTVSVGSVTTGAGGLVGLNASAPVQPMSYAVGLNSYTANTDTYSFTVGISSGGTFVDSGFFFHIFAF